MVVHLWVFLRFYLFIFREKGRREGEKYQYVVASCAPHTGTWPTTQACAQTGNRTSDLLVCRPALNPLSHTSQGLVVHLKVNFLMGRRDR